MEPVLLGLLVVVAVLSRLLEVRLWKAGRLSDRATAILLVGRFPAFCFLGSLISGADWPLAVGITLLGSLPSPFLYRFMLGLLEDQSRERAKVA